MAARNAAIHSSYRWAVAAPASGSMSPTTTEGRAARTSRTKRATSVATCSTDQRQAFGPSYRLAKKYGSSIATYRTRPPAASMRRISRRASADPPANPSTPSPQVPAIRGPASIAISICRASSAATTRRSSASVAVPPSHSPYSLNTCVRPAVAFHGAFGAKRAAKSVEPTYIRPGRCGIGGSGANQIRGVTAADFARVAHAVRPAPVTVSDARPVPAVAARSAAAWDTDSGRVAVRAPPPVAFAVPTDATTFPGAGHAPRRTETAYVADAFSPRRESTTDPAPVSRTRTVPVPFAGEEAKEADQADSTRGDGDAAPAATPTAPTAPGAKATEAPSTGRHERDDGRRAAKGRPVLAPVVSRPDVRSPIDAHGRPPRDPRPTGYQPTPASPRAVTGDELVDPSPGHPVVPSPVPRDGRE